MVPATLVPGARIDIVEGRPEPQGAVTHRQERRLDQATVTQPSQHLGPGDGALPVPLLHGQQLLLAVGTHPDDDQDGGLLPLLAGLQVQPVGEDVDVALAERPAPPEPVLVFPLLLEPQDGVRRQPLGGPDQGAEHRLEVAAGQPLEVEAGEQPALGPRAPLPAAHDLRTERLGPLGDIAHPRLADLHRPHPHSDAASGQMAVAVAAELADPLVAGPRPRSSSTSAARAACSSRWAPCRTNCSITSSGAGTGAVGGRTWYLADTAWPPGRPATAGRSC